MVEPNASGLVESPELVKETEPNSTPYQKPKPGAISPAIVIFTLVFLVMLVVIGFLVYQNQTLISKVSTPVSSATPLPQATATPSPSSAPIAEEVVWKTYRLKDGKSEFSYPADWVVTDESASVDLYQDGKLQFKQDIKVSKNSYVVSSVNPLAWGPGFCLYPGDADFEGPSNRLTSFVQIVSDRGLNLRRSIVENGESNNASYWTICSQSKESEKYTSVSGFGSSHYSTPLDPDEETLKIMDRIMGSIKVQK